MSPLDERRFARADVVVTTALIPGRKAPVLITQDMVDVMKAGSVTVDLAAESGGNIASTVADKLITTPNGVKCVGYTDINSRLASTSSSLFGNNQQKFIMSAGPQTTGTKGEFVSLADSIKGFSEIISGAHDDVPDRKSVV